jgi:hypothetical protein
MSKLSFKLQFAFLGGGFGGSNLVSASAPFRAQLNNLCWVKHVDRACAKVDLRIPFAQCSGSVGVSKTICLHANSRGETVGAAGRLMRLRLRAAESGSRSRARISLGVAINDIFEGYWSLPPAKVADIDAKFNAKHLLPLSGLRRRYARQFVAILKRGAIRTDTEYYLMRGILASFTVATTEAERKLIH